MKHTAIRALGKVVVLGLLSVLAACSPVVLATSNSGESGTTGPVLTWQREGGFAGFCDGLSISADGSVILTDCQGNPVGEGVLSAEQQAQLNAWLGRLDSFEKTETDPAVADAMTVRITFSGSGSEVVSDVEQQAIQTFASEVYAALALGSNSPIATPDDGAAGDVMPVPDAARAYDVAQDALASIVGTDLLAMKQVEITAETWPNSCLGLPEAGEMCAMVLTPGYRIVVEVNGTQYVVRTNQDRSVVRVQGPVSESGRALSERSISDQTGKLLPGALPWEEAVTLIRDGKVAQVMQTHRLEVTLTLKDGTVLTTVEPKIDEVFTVIDDCGGPCKNMILATE